jgi:hypothetical protein
MATPNKNKTTTTFVEDLTAQGFALFQKGQEAVTSAARALADDLSGYSLPKVPTTSADLKKALDDGYRLFGQLIDVQRALAHQIVETFGTIAWPQDKVPGSETTETN